MGKLPARVLYKDTTLFDSRVIFRYLDELSGAGLYSKNRLWDTLTLKALTDEIEESAILMVYETRLRPAGNRSEECVGAQWEKIIHGLDALKARKLSAMNGSIYFGQLSTPCALIYLDFRYENRAWPEGRAYISTWNDSFQERPSLRDTIPTN